MLCHRQKKPIGVKMGDNGGGGTNSPDGVAPREIVGSTACTIKSRKATMEDYCVKIINWQANANREQRTIAATPSSCSLVRVTRCRLRNRSTTLMAT